jgi:hypothetical protein
MANIAQRAIAMPVRALTWLGGQGTRAIAALVFIGKHGGTAIDPVSVASFESGRFPCWLAIGRELPPGAYESYPVPDQYHVYD